MGKVIKNNINIVNLGNISTLPKLKFNEKITQWY